MAKMAKPDYSGDKDFISRLPDEIITQILSLIPTNCAVATSVLSKRWNHLWTSVPYLDFGKYLWLCDRNYSNYDKFVDRVLTLNTVPSVRRIRLQHDKCPDLYRVNAWVSSIAKRDAEEVDLMLYTCPNFDLPDIFFDNKTLVKLKLRTDFCKIPPLVCFPNLITIHLRYTRLNDEDSIKNLMLGCPVLKNLYMRVLKCGDARTFDICSPTLEILQLQILYERVTYQNGSEDIIIINAPNLRDLELVADSYARYNIMNASSMVKLDLSALIDDQVVSQLKRNMGIMRNLIYLKVDSIDWEDCDCFPHLLHLTPNLLALALDTQYVSWNDPNEVPHCLMSCLESVEIWIDLMQLGEVKMMISYILKNAFVLKKLSLNIRDFYTSRPEELNELLKALLALPRTSAACQLYYKSMYSYTWLVIR